MERFIRFYKFGMNASVITGALVEGYCHDSQVNKASSVAVLVQGAVYGVALFAWFPFLAPTVAYIELTR